MLFIKAIVWSVSICFILFCSIYYSFKLKFLQFNFFRMFKSININTISSLFLTLAGRIGVGSIAGVGGAIYIGGAGCVFWMWVFALIASILSYVETTIGIMYKKNGIGGPFFYIRYGLLNRKLSVLYVLIFIFAYLIGFIPIQVNTVVSMCSYDGIYIGVLISIVTYLIIKNGSSRISNSTNIVVPVMAFIYLACTLFVILKNFERLDDVFYMIISSAFNCKSFFSSFIPMIIIGFQRGMFANESGIGVGSIASSISSDSLVNTSYIQVLGVYFTTFIICTSSALMIMLSPGVGGSGIDSVISSFDYYFGTFGNVILFLCVFLFAFSTILTTFYYLSCGFNFLGFKEKYVTFFVLVSILCGSIFSSSFIWNIVDIMTGLLSVINIYSLYKLRKNVL